ncbi:MAG: DUF362 domain-containing protein [Bacteroidales bacterium]|nr:DUF362 domain-containing protein [Bacteroidales bacterium]
MTNQISRRKFIQKSSLIGAGAFFSSLIVPRSIEAAGLFGRPDICIYHGKNHYTGTLRAIEKLGGIKKFIDSGDKVGLLVNSDFEILGAYPHADIVLAVLKECYEQEASQIACIQNIKPEYWKRGDHYQENKDYVSRIINNPDNTFPSKYNPKTFTRLDKIDGAKCLKKVEITKAILECDKFISISIAKHHALTLYTGALKNMMGVGTRENNVYYHLGSEKRNDPDFLGQCIADINMLRQPDLILIDGTEFITTNGPVGPGETKIADKIFAGTDLVAMDCLGAETLGYQPEEIVMIKKAEACVLGTSDLSSLKIKEIHD